MSQKNPPGYPLPDGELGNDDIVCQLVFLPDRDEYWQALLGAIHYMSTWLAWERDAGKRGKDAAANWREAFELTMGCWRMACLDDLKQDVSDILQLLRNSDACCGDTITYGDSTTYITIIIPGDGDPPDYYGETEVADWDEWKEYLCHNANLWVDELVRAAETVETALTTGGMSIALLAAIVAAIAFFVVGGVLALPLLMIILFGLTTGVSSTIFDVAAGDIEDARDDILCAIIEGRSVSDEVETALSSGTAWDLLYSFIDYDSSVAILYEGGDGNGQYLEAELDDSCVCVCEHFQSVDPVNNPVIYQSASGAQFQMKIHAGFGMSSTIGGNFRLNRPESGPGWCGPTKIIDTISVNDALDFTLLSTWINGVEQDSWGPDAPPACNYDISVLENQECNGLFISRHTPAYDGCAVTDIIITITYHDA
ncbi:hypothetical protein KAR91_87770 [Candidatus Pacearchaeota archaeon]|nr:hypothetical protein [Candidatus Pacearchaeota archaeon]